MSCQFSKREFYEKLEEIITDAIKDRSDVLPDELVKNLIDKLSDIPTFNGTSITNETVKKNICLEIFRNADLYIKDIDLQIKVSIPRKKIRLKQKKVSEEK